MRNTLIKLAASSGMFEQLAARILKKHRPSVGKSALVGALIGAPAGAAGLADYHKKTAGAIGSTLGGAAIGGALGGTTHGFAVQLPKQLAKIRAGEASPRKLVQIIKDHTMNPGSAVGAIAGGVAGYVKHRGEVEAARRWQRGIAIGGLGIGGIALAKKD